MKFGIFPSKFELEIIWHFKRHGKFRELEVLAQCPLCAGSGVPDHRVLYFICKCGDPFFCHLNNMSEDRETFPTGKIDVTKANWSKMFE